MFPKNKLSLLAITLLSRKNTRSLPNFFHSYSGSCWIDKVLG